MQRSAGDAYERLVGEVLVEHGVVAPEHLSTLYQRGQGRPAIGGSQVLAGAVAVGLIDEARAQALLRETGRRSGFGASPVPNFAQPVMPISTSGSGSMLAAPSRPN